MRPNVSDGTAENSSTLKMEAAGHCKMLAVSDMLQNIVSKKIKFTFTRHKVIWVMRPNVSDGPGENSSTLKMEAAGHCKTLAVFWHATEYRVKIVDLTFTPVKPHT